MKHHSQATCLATTKQGRRCRKHAAIEELLVSPGNATARASAARLVADKLSTSSPLSMELARRAAFEEMAAQMKAEMPAARAKLERLIESRAEARARELTVELERRTSEAEGQAGGAHGLISAWSQRSLGLAGAVAELGMYPTSCDLTPERGFRESPSTGVCASSIPSSTRTGSSSQSTGPSDHREAALAVS